MFTAFVTLKSSVFGPRLQALIDELKRFGGTVWLKGLTLHVEVPRRPGSRTTGELRTLLSRYEDVVQVPLAGRPDPVGAARLPYRGYQAGRGA